MSPFPRQTAGHTSRWVRPVLFCSAFSLLPFHLANAQEPKTEQTDDFAFFEGFESHNGNKRYSDWVDVEGAELVFDSKQSFMGNASARIDCRQTTLAFRELNAEKLRGKRLRFSAYVKVSNLGPADDIRLGMRTLSLSKSGRKIMLAFDNMRDRPIESTDWQKYEIGLDVDATAQKIEFGFFADGEFIAWFDEMKIETVGSDVPTTGRNVSELDGNGSLGFATPWLWLVGFALCLFLIAHIEQSIIQRFCLWFSFAYWLLYFLPQLIATQSATNALTWVGVSKSTISNWDVGVHQAYYRLFEPLVDWTAANVLGIENGLTYSSTGSGDTAFLYVFALICFAISMLLAGVMTCIPYFGRGQTWQRDCFRTFLRYSLAIQLLAYGMIKAGFISTQFAREGLLGESELDRTFGEASPMGLLWTFMAASPTYTFVAGLLEIIPALLLVFRRTMVLGALLACGVMTNVFILNLCFDVPVKFYSFHLLVASILVLLPDLSRIGYALIGSKIEASSNLISPLKSSRTGAVIHSIAKPAIVILFFALPLIHHVINEATYNHATIDKSEHLLLNREFRWVSEYPLNR